ncbi:MAG: DNA repair protein RecO [Stappiaceae bacterium]
MEWNSPAVVLGTRKLGENDCILEVMTSERGRHLGLVRGGRSRKKQPALQAGNHIDVIWRARLSDHLGYFTVEPMKMRAADLMNRPVGLLGVQVLASLLRLLPERDPHPALYKALEIILDNLSEPVVAGATLVRFELQMLKELGFGLDLDACAATGINEELIWVSPKSGRAVSRSAGEPFADRLLPLPAFLRPNALVGDIDHAAMREAFELSGFFLSRHVYQPRGLAWPEERDRFLKALDRELA